MNRGSALRATAHARAQRGMAPHARAQRGLTLIELIVTLSLLAIVAVIGATLIGSLATGQRDGIDRLAASGAADAALRRMARELQGALPNSVRVTRSSAGGVDTVFIEFVPVVDGGRYRAKVDATAGGPGDPLDLADPADDRFDVIGAPIAAGAAGSQLVIQNLGNDLADAYAGQNRRAGVALPAGGTQVAFTPAGAFPQATDSQRFFLVGTPISFVCEPATLPDGRAGYRLWRLAGYGWHAAQPAVLASGPLGGANRALLLEPLAGCDAAYSTALANIGLLTARLAVPGSSGAPALPLMAQIAIDNTP
jgi:MSHA biogenesis protein MshO